MARITREATAALSGLDVASAATQRSIAEQMGTLMLAEMERAKSQMQETGLSDVDKAILAKIATCWQLQGQFEYWPSYYEALGPSVILKLEELSLGYIVRSQLELEPPFKIMLREYDERPLTEAEINISHLSFHRENLFKMLADQNLRLRCDDWQLSCRQRGRFPVKSRHVSWFKDGETITDDDLAKGPEHLVLLVRHLEKVHGLPERIETTESDMSDDDEDDELVEDDDDDVNGPVVEWPSPRKDIVTPKMSIPSTGGIKHNGAGAWCAWFESCVSSVGSFLYTMGSSVVATVCLWVEDVKGCFAVRPDRPVGNNPTPACVAESILGGKREGA